MAGALHHPLSDEFYPVTKGDVTFNNLLSIFGPPQVPVDFDPREGISHERFSVVDMFRGKSVYLENTISTMVRRTFNSWLTEYILPAVEHNDINFSWERQDANRTLMPITPMGAPPERVSQKLSHQTARLNRYQLGFICNTETLKTDQGQFSLALDMVNIAMAIGDTLEQLGIMALLERKNYWREKHRLTDKPYGNPAELFASEKHYWDILRKNTEGRGFYELAQAVRQSRPEIIDSDVILPEGGKQQLTVGSGNQDFYRHGPGNQQLVEQGSDAVGPVIAAGLRVHVVRTFTINQDGTRVAPLHRVKTIGDHFRLEDYASECQPDDYRSCARNIKVGACRPHTPCFARACDFIFFSHSLRACARPSPLPCAAVLVKQCHQHCRTRQGARGRHAPACRCLTCPKAAVCSSRWTSCLPWRTRSGSSRTASWRGTTGTWPTMPRT